MEDEKLASLIFLGCVPSDTCCFQNKVANNENVAISKRAYTTLEIMSI
jgi:hypothetical protein